MAEVIDGILIREVETKNIMTKSSLPVGGYSVNPYVGCTHACKYCYASFMKRFTGHTEEWGTFLDVKHWPEIKNPKKYAGQRVVIGSVTDGYNPQEEQFGKALHKRSIAILAGMCTAHIGIDRVPAYRQTGLGHDVLCFHLTNEDSINYFCHDLCTSNTLLNSSGIS